MEGWFLHSTGNEYKLPLNITEVRNIVETEFNVEEVTMEFGVLSFKVKPVKNPKKPFENLVKKLKPYMIFPTLRRKNGDIKLYIFNKPQIKPSKIRVNIILFLATMITVFLSGYINSLTWSLVFNENVFLHALYFTIALLGIVGLHELGHKIVCKLKGMEATLPYFIPGPPFPLGFGTFGAVIMQKEPAINRDHLFDLGFSGPIVGFIATLTVVTISIQGVRLVDVEVIEQLREMGIETRMVPVSLAWIMIVNLANLPLEYGKVLLIPPVGLAAWLGFVITFLNLLPVGQLDGGHLASAIFGERGHAMASMIGVIITFVTGFWFFGLLILFLMFQTRRAAPLDDVSPLSLSRRILGFIAFLMMILSAIVLW
ncbi:MAG: site-2 protease family protein [Candidatus Bathyarchaeota archaeon]|nr:site-2 protease family protein [Candidatus Bathyarchaeota archaeon]